MHAISLRRWHVSGDRHSPMRCYRPLAKRWGAAGCHAASIHCILLQLSTDHPWLSFHSRGVVVVASGRRGARHGVASSRSRCASRLKPTPYPHSTFNPALAAAFTSFALCHLTPSVRSVQDRLPFAVCTVFRRERSSSAPFFAWAALPRTALPRKPLCLGPSIHVTIVNRAE